MSIRHYIGWVVLLLAWVPVSGAAEEAACDPWAAKMASLQGKVEAKRANSDKWQVTHLNEIFCAGDHIRVGAKSRAGIILANETLVRLDQNTALTLATVEKATPSLVEILKGIAHFISRVPRSLKVNTPFVNAAIEGTEFVVAVSGKQTQVTVFEGTILTKNSLGEVRITDGESIIASKGSAPSKTLLAKPRDTVQWALYFPPVIAAGKGKLSDASNLLNTGRVNEAKKILQAIDSGDARALLSIIAVVNNDKDTAFKLATQAIKQAPESAAAHIAMSYVWQAKLNLKQALASAQQAIKSEPNNAIAWARLAELQLSIGELDEALASAKQAAQLNANLSRTQSILGYAYLVRIDIDDAMAAFNKAIVLDQVDPLPHLGLGLAKIRKNDLKQGRREIEIAALLDPNNAIIRSYLGKAYYEEKRGPLDATQFAMAKALDPNDPTPYYYDAIRKQTENRPVEALADLNKSIELNDNRAVYRSSLQLDQDEAARSANMARIYSNLGLEQLALLEGWKSVNIDPANHSAHRLLADSYASIPRHGVASASELLQSQLLQPINTTPIQPQLTQANLAILKGTGPANSSINELNPLFVRDGIGIQLNAVSGSNNTWGDDLVVSGINGIFSYSLGQFHYESDGFRTNNDLEEDIYNIYLQAQVSPRLNLQAEFRQRETNNGDLDMEFDLDDFSTLNRRTTKQDTTRIGAHYATSNNSDVLVSLIHADFDATQQTLDISPSNDTTTNNKGDQGEVQYIYQENKLNIKTGLSKYNIDNVQNIVFDWTNVFGFVCPPSPPFPSVTCTENNNFTSKHQTAYIYSDIKYLKSIIWTLGFSYDSLEQRGQNLSEINPKVGLQWDIDKNTRLRAAYFENITRLLIVKQSIEPVQVAGFNQFYDEANGSITKRSAIGIDHKFNKKIDIGFEASYRDIEIPEFSGNTLLSYANRKEKNYFAYLNLIINDRWSFITELEQEKFSNTATGPDTLKTITLPLKLKYHNPNGLSADLEAIHVKQEVDLGSSSSFAQTEENFNIVNFSLGYRLPKRIGTLSLQVNNLFDTNFLYHDTNFITTEPGATLYLPERTIIGRVTLNY